MLDWIKRHLSQKNKHCYFCGYRGEYIDKYLCPDCRLSLHRVDHSRCSSCGKALESSKENLDLCIDCEKTKKYFSKSVSPLIYEGNLKKHIYDFKYKDQPCLRAVFAEYMIEELINSDMENNDIIIPIPLHNSKENSRGYNQSELLSGYISNKLGIRHDKNNLIRVMKNSVQKELSRHQREKNLLGAFTLKNPQDVRGKNILLVDDIYTTGATLNENAKILSLAGAKRVNAITIAISREKRRDK